MTSFERAVVWHCGCGRQNSDMDAHFCSGCGQPRKGRRPGPCECPVDAEMTICELQVRHGCKLVYCRKRLIPEGDRQSEKPPESVLETPAGRVPDRLLEDLEAVRERIRLICEFIRGNRSHLM